MLKKIDKLISLAFWGPFVLTYAIVLFILLTVFIQKYLEDLVGKDLGLQVYAEMIFYFSINQTTLALPLAVLLSALMSFGSLGEHYEITAIKSAGISLLRILLPVAIYATFITIGAYFFNNYIVPQANLKAFRLLYDIRQKKPSLDIKEGGFYNGISGYSIRIEKKSRTNNDLYGIMIYDHTAAQGNMNLILADTGQMTFKGNNSYLILDLGKGYAFNERTSAETQKREFQRDHFEKAQFVFPLSSFQMKETDEDLFKSHRVMKNTHELQKDVDSLRQERYMVQTRSPSMSYSYWDFMFLKTDTLAILLKQDSASADYRKCRSPKVSDEEKEMFLDRALNKARQLRNLAEHNRQKVEDYQRLEREVLIEKLRKYTLSFACLIMFFIGAPLGAIIKKGGLGVPVLVSIAFFLLFYVISITGEKYAKEGLVNPYLGAWFANALLFVFGLFFLRQAHHDSRLFDTDIYVIFFNRLKQKYFKK